MDERLFGLEGAEVLYRTPADVWTFEFEPTLESYRRSSIEEWTTRPPIELIRPADLILDDLEQWVDDEMGEAHCPRLPEDPELVAITEQLREAIAARITWRQADQKVAEHVLDVRDGVPYFDGELLKTDGSG